jgi:uncharacterized protein (DUF952 family)
VSRIYKLLGQAEWEAALALGRFEGSAVDRADGFIHFSTAAQAGETGARYFRGVADLMVLAVDAEALGAALKWEPSRGGDLFPHLYGALACAHVLSATAVELDAEGQPRLDGLAP